MSCYVNASFLKCLYKHDKDFYLLLLLSCSLNLNPNEHLRDPFIPKRTKGSSTAYTVVKIHGKAEFNTHTLMGKNHFEENSLN